MTCGDAFSAPAGTAQSADVAVHASLVVYKRNVRRGSACWLITAVSTGISNCRRISGASHQVVGFGVEPR